MFVFSAFFLFFFFFLIFFFFFRFVSLLSESDEDEDEVEDEEEAGGKPARFRLEDGMETCPAERRDVQAASSQGSPRGY